MRKNTYTTRSTLVKQNTTLDSKKKAPPKRKISAPGRMTNNRQDINVKQGNQGNQGQPPPHPPPQGQDRGGARPRGQDPRRAPPPGYQGMDLITPLTGAFSDISNLLIETRRQTELRLAKMQSVITEKAVPEPNPRPALPCSSPSKVPRPKSYNGVRNPSRSVNF
jgi:hypothetical protein